MNSRENEEFTALLRQAVREAEQLGYKPNRFKRMLDGRGGFETVKAILASGTPSEGFTKLWELNRLDLTCEAIIVESKWRRYFDDALVASAEKLLQASSYPFTPYSAPRVEEKTLRSDPSAARRAELPLLEGGSVAPSLQIKSELGINDFFALTLKAPVANPRWSWGSVDELHRRVYLRLWRIDISTLGGREVIRALVHEPSSKHGWHERKRHLDLIRSGYSAFGVLCEKESPESSTILSFDHEHLLVLGQVLSAGHATYLEVQGKIAPGLVAASPIAASLDSDLLEVHALEVEETTRMALVDARLGQGSFRRELMNLWGGACSVTGCRVTAVLRASHCKPWSVSDNSERLDPHNGLMLQANLDALFDAGLITFDDLGDMLVANSLSPQERRDLGLPARLARAPVGRLKDYLRYHREQVFVDRA